MKGPANAFLAAFVRSVMGWHFVAPRSAEPIRIGKDGTVRAPPSYLRFLKDGGMHSFFAFAVSASEPPRIIARSEHKSPISAEDLNSFAVDLERRSATFSTGRLVVFVARANA